MTLYRPAHVRPIAAGSPVSWHWEDRDPVAAYEPGDEVVASRLGPLARRAQLALGVAIGEWIVFTLDELDSDTWLRDYLEAAWLGTVHFSCCPYMEFADEEWTGPVRGPLHLTMMLLNDALHFEGAEPAENAAWLSTLAQLIVPRDAGYLAWRDAVLDRLERSFPAVPEDEEDVEFDWQAAEPLVPRECFDLSTPFDAADSAELVRRRFAEVDWEANAFMSTPEERQEAGVVVPVLETPSAE
ncbi:hypothetical protein [Homoserinibacter sp. YIM 151385]|uniref:hypothetical protein n=1 Tax=Homoserinibacter sp. YIM 151385 TaxID=2985506 RepID=UPI0022F11D89|nr:hypothetical protein [Homoserinibacter sp. YIM 151385]WBU38643.1 hypothetical protein OF852_03385 [Homoserinibacter sp. YIM 151385]